MLADRNPIRQPRHRDIDYFQAIWRGDERGWGERRVRSHLATAQRIASSMDRGVALPAESVQLGTPERIRTDLADAILLLEDALASEGRTLVQNQRRVAQLVRLQKPVARAAFAVASDDTVAAAATVSGESVPAESAAETEFVSAATAAERPDPTLRARAHARRLLGEARAVLGTRAA